MSSGKFKVDEHKIFLQILEDEKLPLPIREFQFAKHLKRKWRADYCWPEHELILEVEGGVFSNGGHVRGKGFMFNMEKYNTMTELGYRLIRTTPDDLVKKVNIELIRKLTTSNFFDKEPNKKA